MNPKDITLVVAIDREYSEKFLWTYQTWIKFKPEIRQMPIMVIYEGMDGPHVVSRSERYPYTQSTMNHMAILERVGHPDVQFVEWDHAGPFASQREKMLTSLVISPSEYVKTPWYLKLDADTFAKDSSPWLLDEWFLPENGKLPAFIASPWGYTKPANLLDVLDDWGDNVQSLVGTKRLNIPYEPNATRVCSSRMASWVMFGNAKWLKEVVKSCPDRKLPVPSQDTFLYYIAARRGDFYRRAKMKRYGWDHISKKHKLIPECQRLLGV